MITETMDFLAQYDPEVGATVKKEYERIRDLYGPDADYETNPDLKNRCEKLAKRYWRGARIEEFDSLSPEYGIRIEKHSKQ